MNETDISEIARLVELSEARAYRSLITAGPDDLSKLHGFRAVDVSGAVAIMADTVSSSLNLNRVIGLGIDEPATEATIDEICDLYEASGVPYAFEISPAAQPEELKIWMRAKRIRKGFDTAILYREATQPPSQRFELDIKRTGPKHADVLAKICCRNFNMPDAVRPLLAATVDQPGWRHWIAFEGRDPVAASLSFVESEICWLGWTSTLPEYRGRKANAAIVMRILQDAFDASCKWVTAETANSTEKNFNPAYLNFMRLGFNHAYLRPTYVAVNAVS